MKRIGFYMLLVIVILLSFSAGALAKVEAIKIYLNDEHLMVSADPVIEEGTTLVPMRSIFESLGLDIVWDGSTKTVTGLRSDVVLQLTVGEYKAYVNGSVVNLEVPAKIINGTTMVPIRFVSESVGSKVEWNGVNKSIKITTISSNDVNKEVANGLYVENGIGKYADYMKLNGYPDQDKYQIYFKGNTDSFMTTIEDLRGIDLEETIVWEYKGVNYENTRKELYGFFTDTRWFRNNLNDDTDYTLTHEWFMDIFGNTFWEWVEGIGYSSDASRWTEEYFRQTDPIQSNVTLTPDAEFKFVEEPKEEPSIDKIIERIRKNTEN